MCVRACVKVATTAFPPTCFTLFFTHNPRGRGALLTQCLATRTHPRNHHARATAGHSEQKQGRVDTYSCMYIVSIWTDQLSTWWTNGSGDAGMPPPAQIDSRFGGPRASARTARSSAPAPCVPLASLCSHFLQRQDRHKYAYAKVCRQGTRAHTRRPKRQ